MSRTAARLLGLLSLLSLPRNWTGTELAERLEVSTRTIRNDIGSLRDLGYPIEGIRGGEGGYQLGTGGSSIPPLLLDPEEATAVAVGLHSGLRCIIGGMEETSAQALAKLERILPSALRHRVRSLTHFTVPLADSHPLPLVEPALLTLIIEHCHDGRRIRFDYCAEADGTTSVESFEVEPYRLVNHQHRWHLLACDPGSQEWLVFHVERIRPKVPSGPRFTPRPLPAEDIGTFVARNVSAHRWRHTATVIVAAPAKVIVDRLMPAEGTVDDLGGQRARLTVGAESLSTIALTLARLDCDFTILDSPELTAVVAELADRLGRSTDAGFRVHHS